MTDTSLLDSMIIRHVEDIALAFARLDNEIADRLGEETARVFAAKQTELGWSGEADRKLEDAQWLAPPEWGSGSEDEDEHDLFVCLETDNEGGDHSWPAYFICAAGTEIYLEVSSDAFEKSKSWKSFLTSDPVQKLVSELVATGKFSLVVNRSNARLFIPINFVREDMVAAFEDEDFSKAFQPLGEAIDAFASSKPLLERLLREIRAD